MVALATHLARDGRAMAAARNVVSTAGAGAAACGWRSGWSSEKPPADGGTGGSPAPAQRNVRESDMISEMQIHTIARQMLEKHGFEAIAQAAQNAIACESKGEADEAREWRHLEDAMK